MSLPKKRERNARGSGDPLLRTITTEMFIIHVDVTDRHRVARRHLIDSARRIGFTWDEIATMLHEPKESVRGQQARWRQAHRDPWARD